MKFQILSDSCCDLYDNYLDGTGIGFKTIPLKINVGEKEFIDDANLDPNLVLAELKTKHKSGSACPAPENFSKYFDDADYTFIVTITAKLSGCYNSALVAKNGSDKKDNIHVIDSMATSGTEILLIDKLVELINKGLSFEDIVTQIEKYRDECTLYFVLQRFDNLVNNGRMSKIAGLIASTLVIRPICKAVDGEIKISKKTVGTKNAYNKLVSMICEEGKDFSEREIMISHCNGEEEAKMLAAEIEQKCGFKKIRITKMRGLTSYYALEKGVIVCY